MMDCASEDYRSKKCGGGYINDAFKFAKTSLMALRENYPYLAFNGSCRKTSKGDIALLKFVPKFENNQ